MMPDFSYFTCPFISNEYIRNSAEDFRATYCNEDILPIDINAIIECDLGLHVIPTKRIRTIAGSRAFLTFDRKSIRVDTFQYSADSYEEKMRFALAHEVGHFVLHESIYKHLRAKISSQDDWACFMRTCPERQYRYFEYQANEFGGRLLVPLNQLEREIQICCDENDMNPFGTKDPEAFLSAISPDIAEVFGVSHYVIQERVKRENIWPPDCLK